MTSFTDAFPDAIGPVTEDRGVVTIAVSTAAAGTSLWRDALLDGTAALRSIARDERDVGAILLVGTGKNFCAGGDVRSFASAPDRPAFLRGLADDFHAFVGALYEADRPVVAAVHGWAAGAGMSLALHADVIVGGTSTHMRPAYPGIGLSPDGGLTWTLPRIVGPTRARAIILTDAVLDAAEALRLGLLTEVVDDDEVATTARATAERLAAGPREALRAARSLLSSSLDTSLVAHLAREGESISRLSGLAEGIEGVDAFTGKRQPDFAATRPSGRP